MAAPSIDSSSSSPHNTLNKDTATLTNSSPMLSPSSDKRFWSALRNRVDTLLENHKPIDQTTAKESKNSGVNDRAKRLKEDSMLLLKGFDSVSSSLSQLSSNIESALQGARDLAKPPTLSDIVHSTIENAKNRNEQEAEKKVEAAEGNRGLKRKIVSQESPDDREEDGESSKELGKLRKAKNIAISMAKKAASLAKELKSMKADMCFMQERCVFLEEENRRLRDGFAKGIRPEEDDLMRLQMEALLAEKSRLANENANLTRENQCLNQLVEYHQLTSQDLEEAYEHEIRGMRLDFSSPPPTIPEEDSEDVNGDDSDEVPSSLRTVIYGFSASLGDEQEQ